MAEEKIIDVVRTTQGYKETTYQGTCSDNVTVKDIEKRVYHPVFGGRSVFISQGSWTAIRHND